MVQAMFIFQKEPPGGRNCPAWGFRSQCGDDLFGAAFAVTRSLAGLLHQFLVVRQAVAQLAEAFAKLIAIAGLILDALAELIAELGPLLVGAIGQLLLQLPFLGLVLFPGLFHFLHRFLHFIGQVLVLIGIAVFDVRSGDPQPVAVTLLDLIAIAGTGTALSHEGT